MQVFMYHAAGLVYERARESERARERERKRCMMHIVERVFAGFVFIVLIYYAA